MAIRIQYTLSANLLNCVLISVTLLHFTELLQFYNKENKSHLTLLFNLPFFLLNYNTQCLAKIILPRVKTDEAGQQIFCAVLANLAQCLPLLSALRSSLKRHIILLR